MTKNVSVPDPVVETASVVAVNCAVAFAVPAAPVSYSVVAVCVGMLAFSPLNASMLTLLVGAFGWTPA